MRHYQEHQMWSNINYTKYWEIKRKKEHLKKQCLKNCQWEERHESTTAQKLKHSKSINSKFCTERFYIQIVKR